LAVVTIALLLFTGAAFAVLGSFNVPYGGGFTLTPDATTPTNVLMDVRAVGLASFGNSTLAIHATFDTTQNPNPITQGQFVLTAPNGDQAYGVLTGGANTIDNAGYSKMRGNYRFTGGTGRFATVRGSGTWTGLSRTDNATTRGLIEFTFNGTIGN
jgi:hypothetical protein